MPHSGLRLTPGVNEVATPALNTAGVSECQLIRYKPDPISGGLIEKLGGWSRWFPNTMAAIPRALWAWQDTNADKHLAVGTENIGVTDEASLSVITDGVQDDITPRSDEDNIAPVVETVAGSSTVTITDATIPDITDYDAVYIQTHISVGGLILFGLYRTYANTSTTYDIVAHDILGNPLPAPSSSTSPVLAVFDTTMDSNVVEVTLPAHGYIVGNVYPVLASTTVGGVVLYGDYLVQEVTSASVFTILAQNIATSTDTETINGGNARYVYSFGIGSPAMGSGFGSGPYGGGGFGVGSGTPVVPSLGDPISADDWTLDNWGDELISCPVNDTLLRPVYRWGPLTGDPIATIIPDAPPLNDGVFIAMPQRQIVAWGSTFTGIQDPLLIRWCDVNNYNVWVGQITNQAGSYRLPRGSKIVAGVQSAQQGIIWTDLGVWSMQYIGQPLVYSFNQIGSNCGLVGRKAAAAFGNDIYWMGFQQFYVLSGNGVQTVPCPVWDVVFQNLDADNAYKIRCAVNSRFGEIEWFYPSLDGGGEVDSYVKLNVFLGAWDYGLLARSAWIDQSVLGPPIGADPATLYLQQHEMSPDADGQALLASFQTGYMAMSEADVKVFVDQLWPDAQFGYYGDTQNATLNITFFTADYAGTAPIQHGPYAVTKSTTFITPRFRARLLSIKIDSTDVGSFWRLGLMRYRYAQDGQF